MCTQACQTQHMYTFQLELRKNCKVLTTCFPRSHSLLLTRREFEDNPDQLRDSALVKTSSTGMRKGSHLSNIPNSPKGRTPNALETPNHYFKETRRHAARRGREIQKLKWKTGNMAREAALMDPGIVESDAADGVGPIRLGRYILEEERSSKSKLSQALQIGRSGPTRISDATLSIYQKLRRPRNAWALAVRAYKTIASSSCAIF